MTLVESFSGIRGIFGAELNENVIKKYARAYFIFLTEKKRIKNPKIVIGMDTRFSGEEVLRDMLKALDCEIINIGISPTPAVENAVRTFNCDGGIIITASHNEPLYNGFKFLDKEGGVLRANDANWVINKFKEIKNKIIDKSLSNQRIEDKSKEAVEEYKKFIKDIVKSNKINYNGKILVDPNGGSGIISKEIFDEYGIKAEYVNMKPMEFKRIVEPTEASLKYLVKDMIDKNYEFLLGFDCDADRVEILFPDGSLVSGNHILALLAKSILDESKSKKKIVVVNDATSYLVKEVIEKHNAKWIEVEVGEANVVDKMIELNSQIGGEGSNGGVIIPPSRCRDGIIGSLMLLKLLAEKKKTLKEMINELPEYHYLKEKIKLKEDFSNIKNKVKEYYIKKDFKILETGDISGGLKAIKNNSWVWFRQSKTEDRVLRIIADSKDESSAEELMKDAKGLLI